MASSISQSNIFKEGIKVEDEKEKEKDMTPTATMIHRSSSRPQLDLSGAAIQGNFEERDPAILLPNQSDDISHLALDIGGELFFLYVSLNLNYTG